MPGLDGLEATRRIRDPSSNVKQHDVPVIALTARAMKEDMKKCLEAGMNGYISKPLKKGELFRVLDMMVSETSERTKGLNKESFVFPWSLGPKKVFDLEMGLERAEGDVELLKEMIGIFFDTLPELTDALRKSVGINDAEGLRASAHKLKSAAGIIGADGVFMAAQELEKTGLVGKMETAPEKLRALGCKLEELEPVLMRFLSA